MVPSIHCARSSYFQLKTKTTAFVKRSGGFWFGLRGNVVVCCQVVFTIMVLFNFIVNTLIRELGVVIIFVYVYRCAVESV